MSSRMGVETSYSEFVSLNVFTFYILRLKHFLSPVDQCAVSFFFNLRLNQSQSTNVKEKAVQAIPMP